MAKNRFIEGYGRIVAIETCQGKKGPFLKATFEDTLRDHYTVACFDAAQFAHVESMLDKAMVSVFAAPLNDFGPVRLYRIVRISGWSETEILAGEGVIDALCEDVQAA